MDVSIGIMAYNEERIIHHLLGALLNQKTSMVNIKEIIIVSSGSTDNTDRIVKEYAKSYEQIKLVVQKERKGKVHAINDFLKLAKSEIIVLESADTIPKEDTIERLCLPFQDENIGIVSSRPVPKIDKKNYLSFVVALQWDLHHRISINKPKFGELIAFRKLFTNLKNNAVDEEYIAMLMTKIGYRFAYVPNAIVYNSGPKTISDFIRQRRRIHCGHLELKKKSNYKPASMDNFLVIGKVFNILTLRNFFPIIFAVMLEGYGRLLGRIDYYSNKRHYVWDIAKSTKQFNHGKNP